MVLCLRACRVLVDLLYVVWQATRDGDGRMLIAWVCSRMFESVLRLP